MKLRNLKTNIEMAGKFIKLKPNLLKLIEREVILLPAIDHPNIMKVEG